MLLRCSRITHHLAGATAASRTRAHSNASLLRLWADLLQSTDASSPPSTTQPRGAESQAVWDSADALLRDQLRAFQGKVDGSILPEQVPVSLMRFYKGLTSPSQRGPFLTMLASRLGVQGMVHWPRAPYPRALPAPLRSGIQMDQAGQTRQWSRGHVVDMNLAVQPRMSRQL